MLMRALITIGLVACLSLARAAEVRDLRVWNHPEYTRAVLDLSESVEYRIFTLEHPSRVVIDIENAGLDHGLTVSNDDSGALTTVRTGIREGDDLRVVFDMTHSVQPKSFLLQPIEQRGHRLVVDLYPTAQALHTVKTVEDLAQASARDVVIAIDAGHGGEDPGAIGANGTYEKDVNLEVAKELAQQINRIEGLHAELTRKGDYYIPLRKRYQLAREAKADLFVSIHADAFYDHSVRGSSVYMLSKGGATSQAARWLAKNENDSDLVGGVRLGNKDDTLAAVLLDLSQSATLGASHDVAANILDALDAIGRTHKDSVERANFVVLRSPDVPSVLVETAFITNPAEERRLNDPQYQERLARAILSGILGYFTTHAPPGTLIAKRGVDTHIVSTGDTLSEIATQYHVSLSSLRSANNLSSDVLYIGAVLKIPPS